MPTSVSLGPPNRKLGAFVAMPTPAGGFAVVWETYGIGENLGLYQRIFDATGAAVGAETGGATADDFLGLWDANIDPTGRVLVLERHLLENPIRGVLQLQLFDRNGLPAGAPQPLESAASGRYQQPFAGTVAWDGSSWLVTWAAEVHDLGPSAIFLRRFGGN